MNYYQVLEKKDYVFKNYKLVPIREEDIQLIKDWRNTQIDILRQEKPITKEQQINYYNQIVKKSFSDEKPALILFSFLYNDSCIGYGGITNIDWNAKNAELSFLLDTNRTHNKKTYEKDFTTFLHLVFEIAFKELNFNRIFTETYDIRPAHISVLEKNGFHLEKRLKQHKRINYTLVDVLIHSCVKNVKS
jgi:RimJ/RimL family protein N-acetyltransferase